MTKKDYQLIADVLRNTDMSSELRSTLAMNFAVVLKQDNSNFKPVRFCQATRPDIADSPAIKANNAEGFIGPLRGSREFTERLLAATEGFERSMPDGTIQHWRPIAK